MNNAIFLPSVSMSPPMELTLAHVDRILSSESNIIFLEYGREIAFSQYNLHGNLLLHLYTLERQRQFKEFFQKYSEYFFSKKKKSEGVLYQVPVDPELRYTAIMSSLASKFRVTSEDQLPVAWRRRIPALEQAFDFIFYNVITAIQKHNIDCIGVFNGRFFDSAAVVHACKQSNIEYFVYDVNRSASQYYFYNDSLHSIRANQDKALSFFDPANKNHIDVAKDYYHKRRYGKRTYEKSYTSGQKAGLLPNELINKSTVVVYPSSDDEYRFLVDNSQYECVDQVSEITYFVEILLKKCPELKICIRMHPNMAEMHPNIIKSYASLATYPNVFLCEPLDDFDTYALMDHASIVVGFCSSIIAEAAYAKKNLCLIGPSVYKGLGLGNEFRSGSDAANFLVEKNPFISPNVNMALMWAAYVNLYGDYLPSFSIVKSIPRYRNKLIAPLTFWRILAALAKAYYEMTDSTSSTIPFRLRLKNLMRRLNNVLTGTWS